MNLLSKALILFTVCSSSASLAADTNLNIDVVKCVKRASGSVQIQGMTSTDKEERYFLYRPEVFEAHVLGQYLNVCMAALTSGKQLRLVSLDCYGSACSPKRDGSTSLLK